MSIRARVAIGFAVALLAAFDCNPRARRPTVGDAGASGLLFIGTIAQCPDASADVGGFRFDAGACSSTRRVSYSKDVVPIFASNCATGETCHQGTWDGARAYDFLVGVPASECCDGRERVKPAEPGQSYLVQKLRGAGLCAGKQMPLGGTLSNADIGVIEAWICEGAPDDRARPTDTSDGAP